MKQRTLKKECGQTVFSMIAKVLAILIVMCSTAVHRPAWASAPRGESATATQHATGRALDHAHKTVKSPSDDTAAADWPMAGANPQRTSWTPEEVRGQLKPVWYRPIEPYIAPKIQIVAANGLLYVSTAKGLYALDADDGDLAWVYPTELPLGHSPTVVNDTLYVGGFDHKIHAIEADPSLGTLPVDSETGYRINDRVFWTFEAQAGFDTNPLVVNNVVYAGNRDGHMYAIAAQNGQLVWKYKTEGPIHFSAAYNSGKVFFASNDSHAYALEAGSGQLVWKSAKLPGAGFHSWWPVVFRDKVIFVGSNNYRYHVDPYSGPLRDLDTEDVFPNHVDDPTGTLVGPQGTEPGEWVDGTITIDTSQPTVTENGSTTPIAEYYESTPWRRTVFILDQSTGQEYTFDYDGDGKEEYAPFLWAGTKGAGNRYPPVVGTDDVLYIHTVYVSAPYIPRGGTSGWKVGTPFISVISARQQPSDEPMALAGGGNLIYWNEHSDSAAGAYDYTLPKTGVALISSNREWTYYHIGELFDLAPGYDIMYEGDSAYGVYIGTAGGTNGIYGKHGDQNPLVPYNGKVFTHRSNSVFAFGLTTDPATALPLSQAVKAPEVNTSSPGTDQLKQELESQVQKILNAGDFLKPGWLSSGAFDHFAQSGRCGDWLVDYWHNPSDTFYTLVRAMPHLPENLQQETKSYLQDLVSLYPPCSYAHTGWNSGDTRGTFDFPADISAALSNHSPKVRNWEFDLWTFDPTTLYAMWKYAEISGDAQQIFQQCRDKLSVVPPDSDLADMPHVHNAFIAGYQGYLELGKLAGYAEIELYVPSTQTLVRDELHRLKALRATNFPVTKDNTYTGWNYCRSLSIARNFMYLVPELANYLHENALSDVQQAIDEYMYIAPYWFVSKFEASLREGVMQPLYDYHALFQAKALILQESREELTRYLDVPAFAVGDLFYIQNLITAIEASHSLEKTATPTRADLGDEITYILSFSGSGSQLTLTDTLPGGTSAPSSFELQGTTVQPTYHANQHRLTWSDTPPPGQEVIIRYEVTVTTAGQQDLVNTAELESQNGKSSVATATVTVNPHWTFLPILLKGE
jgi:hypothetical protein